MPQSKSLYKSTILKQGLVLVLLPLICSTIVLVLLNQLWLSAEQVSAAERRQSGTVGRLNGIFKHWSMVSQAHLGFIGEHDDSYRNDVKINMILMYKELAELKDSSRNEPGQLANLEKLTELIGREWAQISALPETTSAPDTPSLELMQRVPKVLLQMYKLRSEVRKILGTEWSQLQSARAKDEAVRQKMLQFIYVATVFNIVMGLGLAWFFAAGMARRIRLLTTNADHLHRGEDVERRLKGSDELAYLDRVMNDASKRLQEAAQHRQSILSMVAHDMRSPLMSARANLQIMEELEDDYPEEAVDELQSTYKVLSSVLQHVQKLLTTQLTTGPIEATRRSMALPQESAEAPVAQATGRSLASSEEFVHRSPARVRVPSAAPRLFNGILLQPGLMRQSMLLILAPLILQIILLLVINQQLLSTEKATLEQRRCGDIVMYDDMILMDMVRGALAQGTFVFTKAPVMHEKAKSTFAEVDQDYRDLALVCGNNSDWQKFLELAQAASQQQIDHLMAASTSDFHAAAMVFKEVSEMRAKSAGALRSRSLENRLFKENLSRWRDVDEHRMRLSKSISTVIIWSISANFILGLFLILFFAQRTNRRLNSLMRNAATLGRHENLEPCLSGADEIADLDLAIHRAYDRLRSASKERAQIMSTLAQEMQKPLTSAIAHIDQFKRLSNDALSKQSKRYVDLARGSLDRVLALVHDLLTIEQLEIGKVDLSLESCQLVELAKEAIGTVSGLAAQKDITIVNRCQKDVIKADRTRIVQVLVNYLANAIKFSPPGKTISVSAQALNTSVKFMVTDEGSGMDAETCMRVFDKYFQASTEQQSMGFGLGLAICKLIVESHGGKLGVESAPGKGSTFWFEIPY